MKKLLLITTLAISTSAGLASPASDDAVVACLIGNAAVSLHKQIQTHVDAHTATNVAMTYADKRCKGGARLDEGAGDYVWHSIHGMAKEWFKE